MECDTYECMWNRMRGSSNSSENTTNAQDEDNESFFSSSSFGIFFSIVLVVGIFILVAAGVVIQRFVVKIIQKRWRTRWNRRSHVRPRSRGSGFNPNGRVNTISRNYGDLPSYGQVMAAIEQEDAPPPYCEVARGADNPTFLGEHFYRSHLQSPGNQVVRQASTLWALRDRTPPNPANQTQIAPQRNSEVPLGVDIAHEARNDSTVVNILQSPDILQALAQDDNITSNVTTIGPSMYRSTAPPLERPMSIVIHDIDELVNSISVSSDLPPGSVRAKRNRKPKAPRSREYTTFSSDNCAPKSSSNTSSANSTNGGTFVLESTPV